MDLLSLLNDDDSKSAGPSISALPLDPPPSNSNQASSNIAPQDGPTRNGSVDDSSQSRKRPRISDPPSPSSVAFASAPIVPGKGVNGAPGSGQTPIDNIIASVLAGRSPQQVQRGLATQSPESRNNSISISNETSDSLEPSIVNIQPSEELTRFISDFIFLNLDAEGYKNLEVWFSTTTDDRLKQNWVILSMSTQKNVCDSPYRPRQVLWALHLTTVVISDTSEFQFHTRFVSNMTEVLLINS
jgi:hypothetical protein